VFVFRYFIKKWIFGKKPLGKSPLSIDNIVGQKLIVQEVDGKLVVWYEGIYWPVISEEELKPGDTVEVVAREGNAVKVKKVI